MATRRGSRGRGEWDSEQDNADDGAEAGRAAYDAVCRAVHYNTGGPDSLMRAGVRVTSVLATLVAHADRDRQRMRSALSQAEDNGDVVLWEDRDGSLRATLTDAEGVAALVAEENRRDDPCVDLIERAAGHRDDGVFEWPDNYGRSVDDPGGAGA